MRRFAQFCLAIVVTASLLLSSVIQAAFAGSQEEPSPSREDLVKLLQKRIKYVFVIFNENHSFDNEFGTFPGVNGLYSDGQKPRSAANTPGFTQTYTDVISGQTVTVEPFRIGPQQNSTVVDSVDHSHTGLATKLNIVNGVPQMDKFAYDEYHRFAKNGGIANYAKGTQFARLVMSYIDCDTIPFLWKWASQFTIFDNIYATEDTPSTPNAIAMIAGQSGETQWVKHGSHGKTYTNVSGHTGTTQGPPLVEDPQPFYGSQFDKTTVNKQPASANAHDSYSDRNIASNLTFASLPLTFLGRNISAVMAQNLNPSFDKPDIQKDISFIQGLSLDPVNWRWYQEGYDLEATDSSGVVSHTSYVSHHQGPQYFGYLANTPPLRQNFRGMTDFFNDIANKAFPAGGVFYIRGGYTNQMGLMPPITNPNTPKDEIAAIYAAKTGDDDHPSYSDRQISEAMAARVINAIAEDSKLWDQSAIIITYDESDGFYDHVPPRILSYGPDGLPLS
ncbi:MAG: alkaline phosphatase family protein, partial [Thermodesulfovibrionales bacterium]